MKFDFKGLTKTVQRSWSQFEGAAVSRISGAIARKGKADPEESEEAAESEAVAEMPEGKEGDLGLELEEVTPVSLGADEVKPVAIENGNAAPKAVQAKGAAKKKVVVAKKATDNSKRPAPGRGKAKARSGTNRPAVPVAPKKSHGMVWGIGVAVFVTVCAAIIVVNNSEDEQAAPVMQPNSHMQTRQSKGPRKKNRLVLSSDGDMQVRSGSTKRKARGPQKAEGLAELEGLSMAEYMIKHGLDKNEYLLRRKQLLEEHKRRRRAEGRASEGW